VIGDFEARGGNLRLARSYYRRALALDPLDTGLQQLAQLDITPASSPQPRRRATASLSVWTHASAARRAPKCASA